MEGNHNCFPVVRVKRSLLAVDPSTWKQVADSDEASQRTLLKSLWEKNSCKVSLKDKEQLLWTRLRDIKAREIEKHCPDLKSFAKSFIAAAQSPASLLTTVADVAIQAMYTGQLLQDDMVQLLLIGKSDPDNSQPAEISLQLAFDLDTGSIYTQQRLSKIIKELPVELAGGGESRRIAASRRGIDALTGQDGELEDGCFPKVDLPAPSGKNTSRIGRKSFPLSSMFSDAGCNCRYGMTDAGVFPVARNNAIKLKEAIEEITSDARQGKTWDHVPSGHFSVQRGRKVEKKDLLIVYAEEMPNIDANVAMFFGSGPNTVGTQFHVDCQAICNAFDGVVKQRPNSKLQLFLIREMSKGQAQIALAESPRVQDVLDSARRWQQAGANIPNIDVLIPPNKMGKRDTCIASPVPPYPGQVVELLSHQWVRGGTSKQAVVGVGLGEVLWVMLRTEGKWESAVNRMLTMLLQRSSSLLIGVFGAKHVHSIDALSKYGESSRRWALRAASILGILLDALGQGKDTYMEKPAFQIGQVLALADTLHKDYCAVVRKGKMPNTLIGTALMRPAMDNPVGALADLAERILEYVRWAKTAPEPREDEKDDSKRIAVREARKTLRRYQPLATALGEQSVPDECSETMKAELLLGFLASPQDTQDNRKDGQE